MWRGKAGRHKWGGKGLITAGEGRRRHCGPQEGLWLLLTQVGATEGSFRGTPCKVKDQGGGTNGGRSREVTMEGVSGQAEKTEVTRCAEGLDVGVRREGL